MKDTTTTRRKGFGTRAAMGALAMAALVVASSVAVVPQVEAQATYVVTFVQQPSDIGRGIPFSPPVKVKVTSGGSGASGVAVTLAIVSVPAGVRLANGPGQGAGENYPKATTDSQGFATFAGLTVVADSAGFTRGVYQLRATAGTSTGDSTRFTVGRTSGGWPQFHFNAARTGHAPGTADFGVQAIVTRLPVPGGDVVTSPVMIDLNLDGVNDIVAVNRGNWMRVQAYDGATLSPLAGWPAGGRAVPGGCTGPTTCPTYVCQAANPGGIPTDGLASLAAFYDSTGTPFIVVYGSYWSDGPSGRCLLTAAQTVSVLNANGNHITSSPRTTSIAMPTFAPLVAKVGGGGDPDIVVLYYASGPDTRLRGFKVDSGPTLVQTFDGSGVLGWGPWGGSIAAGELRSGHPDQEVVYASSTAYVDIGWSDSYVGLCAPTSSSPSCSERTYLGETAAYGLAVGDLTGDGKPEIVANGLASPQSAALFPTPRELQIWDGTQTSLGGPSAWRTGEGDLMNTPSLADIRATGYAEVVNVQYGAPPPVVTSGDAQTDSGNVQARSYASSSITDRGVWARPGAPKAESPGGGILIDLDHDVSSNAPPSDFDWRPELLFGSMDGNLVATRVKDATTGNPPAQAWTLGNLGTPPSQGPNLSKPVAPPVAADILSTVGGGDCRAEIVQGLTGGEVAVVRGRDAGLPGVPSFSSPIDYTDPDVWVSQSGNPDNIPPFATGKYQTSPGGDYAAPRKQAKLAWNAPTSDGGLPIVEYKVWRATDAAFTQNVKYVGAWPSGIPPNAANPFFDHSSNPHALNPVDLETITSSSTFYYKVAAVTCYTLSRDPAGYGLPAAGRLSGWVQSDVRIPVDPSGTLVALPYGDPAYAVAANTVRVKLSWPVALSSDADKPVGCQWNWGYNVYRRPLPGGPTVQVGATPTAPYQGAGTVTYTDTTATRGLVYEYDVRTVNCVGDSAAGLVATADLRPPETVSPTITPGGSTMFLTWMPPTARNGCKTPANPNGWIEGYRVYRSTSSGTETYLATVLASGTQATPPLPWRWTPGADPAAPPGGFGTPVVFADPGLAVGTRYYYQVAAVNCVGEGVRSAEVSAVAGGSPPPLQVSLTPSSQSGKTAHTFSFSPSVMGGTPPYTCQWSRTPASGSLTPPSMPCNGAATFAGASSGTTYSVALLVTDSGARTATATATVDVAKPLSAALSVSPAWGVPTSEFVVQAKIDGGMGPYTCSWDITPAEGTFQPPAGGSCAPATFKGGIVGRTYTVKAIVSDAVAPVETKLATVSFDVRDNLPPVADFSAPPSGAPGQGIGLADASVDYDGTIVAWVWDFGDGTGSAQQSPHHAWTREGEYLVRLTVIDNFGAEGSVERRITVGYGDVVPTPEPLYVAAGMGGAASLVADAGPDLSATEGTQVTLQGKAAEGLSYTWRQIAGPMVALRGADTATPSFQAPRLDSDEALALQFTLQVESGGRVSPLDSVVVRVTSGNRAPRLAVAAPATVAPGETVTLDASGSTDADGDALAYRWTQAEGPTARLDGADKSVATFTIPADAAGQILRFDVEVSDGRTVSTDSASIAVLAAAAPVASFTVTPDAASPSTFTFRASAPPGLVTWSFDDGSPQESGREVTHTFPGAGRYDVRMSLDDGASTAHSTVPVVVTDAKGRPSADAGGMPWGWVSLGAVAAILLAAAAVVLLRARRRS